MTVTQKQKHIFRKNTSRNKFQRLSNIRNHNSDAVASKVCVLPVPKKFVCSNNKNTMTTIIIKMTTVTTTIAGYVEHVTHSKAGGARWAKPNETKNAWKKKTNIKRHSYHRNTRVTVKERRWFRRRDSSLNRQAWRRRGTAGRGRRLCRGAVSVSKRPPAFPLSQYPRKLRHPLATRPKRSPYTSIVEYFIVIYPAARSPGRESPQRHPEISAHLYCYCTPSRVSSRRACRTGGNFVPGIVYREKEKCLRQQCRGRKQRRWSPR